MADNAGWSDGLPTRWEPPRRLSPTEREAARSAVASLSAMLAPAEPSVAMKALVRLRLHAAKAPEHTDQAWTVILGDYARDLSEFPADIIEAGCEQHRKSSPWWPHVSDLLAIMEPMLNERRNMLARAEKLAAGSDEKLRRYEVTGEERERIQQGFSSLKDILRNMPGPEAV